MKKLLIALMGTLVVTGAWAETQAFNASLVPDTAIYGRNVRINGFALSIWGENPQSAFALGFVNGSTGESAGFSIGLLNYSDNYTGVQWGVVNYAKQNFTGWQSGCVNFTEGTMVGLQGGFVNYAGSLHGLQLGFVNYAESVVGGVQLGFVNIMPENEWFSNFPSELAPGMVFVNWHF